MKEIKILIYVMIISGLVCFRTIGRFMTDKIKTEWSFEYLIFGYGGALVFVGSVELLVYYIFFI